MRARLLTAFAGCTARSPMWLCQVWRFYSGILSVAVIFLLWHFRPHTPSILRILIFSSLTTATCCVFFSAVFSIFHTAPGLSRMYLAARCLASACPPYVYWTTFSGYRFRDNAAVSAHAQATFLRSVTPSELSATAQTAILRGRAEFLHKKLRDKKVHGVTEAHTATPFDPPTHFCVIYTPLPPPLYGVSSTYPPHQAFFLKLLASIKWPFVQIVRSCLSPIVGSWHLVGFHPNVEANVMSNSVTLVSWPVRRHASV